MLQIWSQLEVFSKVPDRFKVSTVLIDFVLFKNIK